jgi:hypothetical protein
MRPGQPPDRIVRGFLPAESPIGVEMTASARQRSNRVPRLPTRVADPSSCDPESALATLASSRPCSEEHGGEEAATPGQPVALARVFWVPPGNSLSRITAAAGSAAIIRQAQELSRFYASTLSQIVAHRNTKTAHRCEEAVEGETSLWKPEEN